MCLDVVEKTGLDLSGHGWKIFSVRDDKLSGDFHPNIVPINKWLFEKDFRLGFYGDSSPSVPYPMGFHIFKFKRDAQTWCKMGGSMFQKIQKVKFRKGHTMGKTDIPTDSDRMASIIVADEIKVEGTKHGL